MAAPRNGSRGMVCCIRHYTIGPYCYRFYRAMLCIIAVSVVSVRPSVTFVYSVETNKRSLSLIFVTVE